jgi:ribosomal protein L9
VQALAQRVHCVLRVLERGRGHDGDVSLHGVQERLGGELGHRAALAAGDGAEKMTGQQRQIYQNVYPGLQPAEPGKKKTSAKAAPKDYKVADLSLAEWGRKEITMAEAEKFFTAHTNRFTIPAKANPEGRLFGSISAQQIALLLQGEGYKVEEKMVLVDQWASRFGVNRTLAALGLSKGTWHYRQQCRQVYTEKYAALKKAVKVPICGPETVLSISAAAAGLTAYWRRRKWAPAGEPSV